MSNSWNWVARYAAVVVVTLILAAALGSMDLFEKTSLFGGKLTAAHLVRFLGSAAALTAFWLLARRAAISLRQQDGRWSFLRYLILPVASLIYVAAAYSVLLLVLKPFLEGSLHNIYNWFFIIVILAVAGWLVAVVLNQSTPMTAVFTSFGNSNRKSCPACGAESEYEAKFCKFCGQDLAVAG